jgi:hypothetical protein
MVRRRIKTPRLLSDSSLHVSPELVGQPVATPLRRAVAFAVDWVVLIVPVLAVAFGAASLALQIREPDALRAVIALWTESGDALHQRECWKEVARLLTDIEAPGVPYAVREAVERGDLNTAADSLSKYELMVSLALGEREEGHLPRGTVSLEAERLIPRPIRGLALFGVALLYFTLCHYSRRGQTLGKRLLGIRVAQLGGERLSLFESLERTAAYLEIPASLGLSLISLWRDPNRRLPHDRIVHTAVLRVTRSGRAAKPARATGRKP